MRTNRFYKLLFLAVLAHVLRSPAGLAYYITICLKLSNLWRIRHFDCSICSDKRQHMPPLNLPLSSVFARRCSSLGKSALHIFSYLNLK
ncbi:uncharacterized protein FOMMEDRAFT_142279 [Fomitiporia mediterranea MF3/22]|uniref:uncharacterized protein n=1 Tax=Fomitiporia mediterranea (strain MF3/22) TaxID=694068 RepID=UPI0004409B8A|nr:uncharacterized protein FOMMEDRAFT_142279 [Fomitiporia mediterranea MF3/22]EJD01759.1 hypothetical protein FOMMEDRAFT_142279 [Fomitiporia mediterranea MF3/22]